MGMGRNIYLRTREIKYIKVRLLGSSQVWSYNSVGSECNSYKVEVIGSSPIETTKVIIGIDLEASLNCGSQG